MDQKKIHGFIDRALGNNYTFSSKEIAPLSRDDIVELLSILLMRVEVREMELKEMVDNLEENVRERTLELQEKNKILEDLSVRDQLTKIHNRRYFDEKLSEYSFLTLRFKQGLSCIMADIDHFKIFNDTYGHQAGDYVLVSFAKILDSHTRKTDVCARYGGEEFVILLPNTEKETANRLAEGLRRDIEAADLEYDGTKLSVTSSFGVADGKEARELFEVLVKRADDALYKAKQRGRNRVWGYDLSELSNL